MDSLLCLPNEVLLEISIHCGITEMSQLTQTCWRLHDVLNPVLYRRFARRSLPHAAEHNNEATVERVFQYTIPRQHKLSRSLALACEGGHAAIVRILLAWGAPPNGLRRPCQPHYKPLATAANSRRLEIVEILLASGARPTGYHPKMLAKIISHCTQSPTYTDPTGGSWRRPMDDPRILQLLVQHGMHIEPDSDILESALRENAPFATIGVLLDLGLDPNQPADVARRPLLEVVKQTNSRFEDDCVEVIHKCVQHGVDINARLPNGETVLHRAAAKPLPVVVRALLTAGADVNARDNRGTTPLNVRRHYSADLPDVPRTLLEGGADMAAVDNQGRAYVLENVIEEENKGSMRVLLDHGLESAPAVDVSDLMVTAVVLEDVSAVRRLVHNFPDLRMDRGRDRHGNLPLHRAARYGLDEIISSLLQHRYTVDIQNTEDDSALHLALRTGKESTARLLMQCPPINEFLNTRNRMFMTPLSIAVQSQPVGIIETLLDKGCNPLTCPDFQRQSLLHHAVRRSDPAITKLLLEQGAARDGNNYAGETPFGIALRLGRGDLVQLFLEHGESPNRRNANGNTGLMAAVLSGSLPVVKQLVAAGAELEAENDSMLRQGCTALMMAMDMSEPDIAQFLFDSGASAAAKKTGGKSLLVRAIQRKWPGLALGMLKRHGSTLDIEGLPSKGIKRTALSWAASLGYVGVVQQLLKLGADPAHCDPDGRSALYWATYGGNMEIICSVVERMKSDGQVDIKADILEEVARHRRDTFKPWMAGDTMLF
ncbi:uncharacterized protein APUU_61318A [Aspergillus puulaauensis]|uniref:F-box domain-containing protein n=1 Tax=Aspergillus puulaauensis TaxID=1220207 RepID=A0A7R8AT02_9EURO|nr:uncharacterized protein APUU_61318A [Aspergillus puulaauensis]BCS28270.1 hypothetical protein APUU_61318A [Aspergillus puulaauensis]